MLLNPPIGKEMSHTASEYDPTTGEMINLDGNSCKDSYLNIRKVDGRLHILKHSQHLNKHTPVYKSDK